MHFPKLEKLDISFNSISSITNGLSNLQYLKYFDASANRIVDFETLHYLCENLDSLTSLDLRFNPISKKKGYRNHIIGTLGTKFLKIFDGVQVSSSEKHKASKVEHQLNEVFHEHASTQPHLFRPLSVRTQTGYGSSAALNEYWKLSKNPDSTGQSYFNYDAITTLELDNCNLFNLDGLPEKYVFCLKKC